jgi:hypothetical protein
VTLTDLERAVRVRASGPGPTAEDWVRAKEQWDAYEAQRLKTETLWLDMAVRLCCAQMGRK